MKKNILIFAAASLLYALTGCDVEERDVLMDENYPADYELSYGLGQVLQYDEMNINGINIVSKLAFFDTYRFTVHFTDSKVSGVTLNNGDVPFSPYSFEVPTGSRIDCYLNTEVLPNELRIKETEQVLAYYSKGEFYIPFKLDCPALDYKYTFKSINQ